MSKRMLASMGVALGMVAMASLALAGDYHFGQDLICSDCHVMHYSQSHGYNPNGSGNTSPLGAGGPFHYLLRNDINDLCLGCHDGQAFAPDVFEVHSNGYVRQAGALNEVGGNGLYPPPTGHTLNYTGTVPSGTWSNPEGLNCTNCHAPHGRTKGNLGAFAAQGGYRNLFIDDPLFLNSITYTRGDVEGPNQGGANAAWVHEDGSAGAVGTHYGRGAITFNEPVQTDSRYAEFCKTCHTSFHGAVGGPEVGGTGTPPQQFVRHPNAGVNIGAIGGGHSNLPRFIAEGANQLQVMSFAGKKAGTYTATDTDLTPSCFSCHKAHGNQNAFGLIYMLGTGTITEQGDNGIDMRNTCRACHTQGGANTNPW